MALGDWRSIVFLIFFIISIVFIIVPVNIPVKTKNCKGCRLRTIPFDYSTVPVVLVIILCAITAIPGKVIVRGIMGYKSPEWALEQESQSKLIPLTIVVLFLTLAYICFSAGHSGLFKMIAVKFSTIAMRSKSRNVVGMALFFVFAAIFTLCTSNDVVVLTLTPIISKFVKEIKSDSGFAPLLATEFAASNSFSVGLLTGNPSNVIITAMFSIDFMEYLQAQLLPAVITGFFVFLYTYICFKVIDKKAQKKLNAKFNEEKPLLDMRDPLDVQANESISKDNDDDSNDSKYYDEIAVLKEEGAVTETLQSTTDEEEMTEHTPNKNPATRQKDQCKMTFNQIYSSVVFLTMFCMFLVSSFIQNAWDDFDLCYISTTFFVFMVVKDIVLFCRQRENDKKRIGTKFIRIPSSGTEASNLETLDSYNKSEPLNSEELNENITNGGYNAEGVSSFHFETVKLSEEEKEEEQDEFNPRISLIEILKQLPWGVPLFLLGMFIMIENCVELGIINAIAEFIADEIVTPAIDIPAAQYALSLFFCTFTCILCIIFNNLPATIVISNILANEKLQTSLGKYAEIVMFASAAGSNYGACIIKNASLSGLMWDGIVKNKPVLRKVWGLMALMSVFLIFIFCSLLVAYRLIFRMDEKSLN